MRVVNCDLVFVQGKGLDDLNDLLDRIDDTYSEDDEEDEEPPGGGYFSKN